MLELLPPDGAAPNPMLPPSFQLLWLVVAGAAVVLVIVAVALVMRTRWEPLHKLAWSLVAVFLAPLGTVLAIIAVVSSRRAATS
jgi:hypothetical protein